jgi:transposase
MDFPTEFAMAAPVRLRTDFDAATLRRLAKAAHDPHQSRRLLALAVIHEGGSRSDAARIADVGLQTVRDWVLRFNAHGPQGLINRKAPGQKPRLNQAQRRALQQVVEQGPIPAVHGVVRWRLIDLVQWVFDAFHIPISKQTMSREVRALGYRKLSARPRHHAKNEQAARAFKKLRHPAGRDCCTVRRQAARDLVCGRGAGRTEEQAHPALGPAR